jgi:trimeric autotransporter adhesin
MAAELVKDIIPGSNASFVENLTAVNNTLFFTVDDGTGIGTELYKSDGTSQGTVPVKDINTTSQFNGGSSNPESLTNVNGTLFFTADNVTNGRELWKSDGTTDGTTLVINLTPETDEVGSGSNSSNLSGFVDVNGILFFIDTNVVTPSLYKSDGTTTGTTFLREFRFVELLINLNGTLLLSADGELWKSDGTPEGTTLVKDINTTSTFSGSSPRNFFTTANGTLFFTADDGVTGRELWKSNGTPEGTVLVKDINPIDDSGISNEITIGDILYFTADDNQNGVELWRSDGTTEGTFLVKNIAPGLDSADFTDTKFIDVNGTLFFTVNDRVNGLELWKSDGTDAGTTLVKDLTPGLDSTTFGEFVNVNGTLFFTTDAGINGTELWQSNGTAEGTVQAADINLGSNGSNPNSLTNVNGTLFFKANNGTNGEELYKFTTASSTPPGSNPPGSTPPGASPLTTSIYRFQNTGITGTYLFVGDEERQSVLNNNPGFALEGEAFKVGVQAGDDLLPVYRFQNLDRQGTYLYVGEEERQNILATNPRFQEEGRAFYVLDPASDKGTEIYRFRNTEAGKDGTYIFVGAQERDNIQANFSNYVLEGVAFEVNV